MKIRGSVLFFLAIFNSLAANDVAPTKSELEAIYGAAAREVNAGNYSEALKQLDTLDARQPEMAAAKNLRGVALMRMGVYGPAEKALQKARELDPALWEARFNLAEVPFLRKNWAEARHRFVALAEEKSEQAQGATGDLIQFKILLTYLLEGKEKKAAAILEQLKTSSASPAYYCGTAAVAFRQKDETEARVALRAAEKSFTPRLNKLFLESFYEVGWLEKPEGATPAALEVSSLSERVARAQKSFAKAERAFRQGDLESALQLLEEVDAATANQAVTYNLRGEIYLAQGKEAAAEAAFRNALAVDPQLTAARYNLARIPFKKGEYEAARRQLEALLGATSGGREERRQEQLIRYRIFLTLLRERRDGPAQKALDEFKMMDDTPALYYAQAAWAFEHGNQKQGSNWVANALNLFSAEMNRSFAEPLVELGWMPGKESPPPTAPVTVAQSGPPPTAAVSPAAESSPSPAATGTPTAKRVADASPAPTPSEQSEEPPARVVAEVAQPPPSATPETSRSVKRIAKEEDQPSDKIASKERKNRASGAESAAEKTDDRSRSRRAARSQRAAPPPVLAAPIEPAPRPHQNLGDKVARLLLYPFRHRNEKNATPTPAGPPPSPNASATPTPREPNPRKN